MKIDDELYPCPCCGFKNFSELGGYEICENCGWEDDPVQSADPDFPGGANDESLNEARKLWGKREQLKAKFTDKDKPKLP